ncbi:MAG: ribosomal-processing cysteine protease Prp [Syntrophomonadaceae bacterium]|jgi:uncharacterized protein YsxB (DUF464 family)|nr:ribosomal-processing cysteine protease Prp [Syntrophomonadaceae bacterium]
MITVSIEYRDEQIVAFTITGHAGYAAPGQDIYCAGVSAIAQTAVLGLARHLSTGPQVQIVEGENNLLQCSLPVDLSSDDRYKAQLILSTMEAGLLSMQEAYPQYVKVIVRR